MEETERLGIGLHLSLLLGFTLSDIQAQILEFLVGGIERSFLLEGLKDNIKNENKEKEINEDDRAHIKNLILKVNSINEFIKETNKNILSEIGFKKGIVCLDAKMIEDIISERFRYSYGDKKVIELFTQNLKSKISDECKKTTDSIKDFLEMVKFQEDFEGREKIRKPYVRDITEAMSIYSIGFGRTAVLCSGRAIELAINDYLKELLKEGKIKEEDFGKLKHYGDKIGFLKDKFINEEEFTKLKAFSFDRDKGGHPNLGEIAWERSKSMISSSIWLVIDIQKKIDNLKNP